MYMKIETHQKVAEIEVSYRPSISNKPIIKTSLDSYTELINFYSSETISLQEKFIAMYVNRCNRVIGVYELSKGGITWTVVDIRLLLSVALKTVATSIILSHNHPSGNLKPSKQDIDLTQKIKAAAELMDIKVMDHIILGTNEFSYYSFADEGIM